MKKKRKFIRWFDEIKIKDIPLVGDKNASLGNMNQELIKTGIKYDNKTNIYIKCIRLV